MSDPVKSQAFVCLIGLFLIFGHLLSSRPRNESTSKMEVHFFFDVRWRLPVLSNHRLNFVLSRRFLQVFLTL